jgi:hypothetical protein
MKTSLALAALLLAFPAWAVPDDSDLRKDITKAALAMLRRS